MLDCLSVSKGFFGLEGVEFMKFAWTCETFLKINDSFRNLVKKKLEAERLKTGIK